jgi:glycosyltransferase involved in cell wall biosynthesis
MSEVLISVCLITYNHVNYIQRAIDSVLAQNLDVGWDIIIADDCSTDGTRDIIVDYCKQFPDRIRLILQDKNVGPAQNWLELIASPKSKYIAYLEGDDFWNDPLKLQKQVSILEDQSHFSGIFTEVNLVDLNSEFINVSNRIPQNVNAVTYDDLIYSNVIHSCSFAFRRSVINDEILSLIAKQKAGDITLFLFCAISGPIYYLNDVTSSYRIGCGIINTMNLESIIKAKISYVYFFFTEFTKSPQRRKIELLSLGRLYFKLNSAQMEMKRSHFLIVSNARKAWYYTLKGLLLPATIQTFHLVKIRYYYSILYRSFFIMVKGILQMPGYLFKQRENKL